LAAEARARREIKREASDNLGAQTPAGTKKAALFDIVNWKGAGGGPGDGPGAIASAATHSVTAEGAPDCVSGNVPARVREYRDGDGSPSKSMCAT
jgi:hypothetical protein